MPECTTKEREECSALQKIFCRLAEKWIETEKSILKSTMLWVTNFDLEFGSEVQNTIGARRPS